MAMIRILWNIVFPWTPALFCGGWKNSNVATVSGVMSEVA